MALLAGGAGVINGPRRPEGAANPCVTIGVLADNVFVRPKHHRVVCNIVAYAGNLTAQEVRGQPDTYKLSAIADRIETLLHDEPLQISGVTNCQMELSQKLGPLFDSRDPDEHYMALRFRAIFR